MVEFSLRLMFETGQILVKFRDGSAATAANTKVVLEEVGSLDGQDALAFGRAFSERSGQTFMPLQNPLTRGQSKRVKRGELLSELTETTLRRREAFLSGVEFVVPTVGKDPIGAVRDYLKGLFQVPATKIKIAAEEIPRPELKRYLIMTPRLIAAAVDDRPAFLDEVCRLSKVWPVMEVLLPSGELDSVSGFIARLAAEGTSSAVEEPNWSLGGPS